ncbi:Eukaryotic initiation factor 5C, partial [Operophtera brumata]
MSQKVEKPVLSGQRIKTRKRAEEKELLVSLLVQEKVIEDKRTNKSKNKLKTEAWERVTKRYNSNGFVHKMTSQTHVNIISIYNRRNEKEKYDPNGFRDALVLGLERAGAGGDLDAAYKFLDTGGSKLDYRRYGEVIFDVLIAGGLLLPGGGVSMDGESPKTNTCIFSASEDMDTMRTFEQVFVKLMRRYKYLEKMFEEEMKKVLVYLKGNGCVPPSVLLVLVNEHLVKDNLALDFVLEVLLEFLPLNKRSEDVLANSFASRELTELLRLHRAQASQEARRELTQALMDELADDKPILDLIQELKEMSLKHAIADHEVVAIIWQCVMSRGEWNKKEELLAEQAAKHLRHYTPLLGAFAKTTKAELALLSKTDVLSEEVILKWYREPNSSKGKHMFLDQMKKFVEWLQSAEE